MSTAKVRNYSSFLIIPNKLISSDTNKTVILHFEVNIKHTLMPLYYVHDCFSGKNGLCKSSKPFKLKPPNQIELN